MAKLLEACVEACASNDLRGDPRAGAAVLWLADVGESIRGIAQGLIQLGEQTPKA